MDKLRIRRPSASPLHFGKNQDLFLKLLKQKFIVFSKSVRFLPELYSVVTLQRSKTLIYAIDSRYLKPMRLNDPLNQKVYEIEVKKETTILPKNSLLERKIWSHSSLINVVLQSPFKSSKIEI